MTETRLLSVTKENNIHQVTHFAKNLAFSSCHAQPCAQFTFISNKPDIKIYILNTWSSSLKEFWTQLKSSELWGCLAGKQFASLATFPQAWEWIAGYKILRGLLLGIILSSWITEMNHNQILQTKVMSK